MNEKYRLDMIGYIVKTRNPITHGDMKRATVSHLRRARLRA